jgi:hypothetical protein
VADELPSFNAFTVTHLFCRFGKLCEFKHVADDNFRGLMVRVREMCTDGQLEMQELSTVMHAVAKMRAAGKLATDETRVEDMLAALEQRAVLLAPTMNRSHVPFTILSVQCARAAGGYGVGGAGGCGGAGGSEYALAGSDERFVWPRQAEPGAGVCGAGGAGGGGLHSSTCLAQPEPFLSPTPPNLSANPSIGAYVEPKSGRM